MNTTSYQAVGELEGLEPTDAAKARFDRYVAGGPTTEELASEMRALNAREFRDPQLTLMTRLSFLEERRPLRDNEKEAMETLNTLRHEKRAEILRLASIHGCRNVRLFGSVVTGENRPGSDVDFLVDMEAGRTIFDLAGFMGDVRDLLGTEVDVVESRSIHPYIRDRVLAEAIGL